ncbi:MAG: 3-dehydroquinate synthase [Kangiellaceae bacterium]|nr:3-dehydroquinate synthase [Kangiellaceae bacterium]
MKTIDLTFNKTSQNYQIQIGQGLLDDKQAFINSIKSSQVLIISNEVVAPLYLDPLKQTLQAFECFEYIVPDGEQHKSLQQFEAIISFMIENRLRRNATIIALGGGVIGDLSGYVAASYYRGIDFIQVPTSLLAQVDSSVGGKTAVNHPLGKNLIGAFHQPKKVITDIDTLKTLPEREFRSGIAEIIKAAIIADSDFFSWLEGNYQAILSQDANVLASMIARSCQIKADIVANDEKEQGTRAWLNLGHTFAHAIEKDMGFGTLLHGEAVAIGLCLAANFNQQRQQLTGVDKQKIFKLVARFGLPTCIPAQLSAESLINAMSIDKKNIDQDLTLILPSSIGRVTIENNISKNEMYDFLAQQLN